MSKQDLFSPLYLNVQNVTEEKNPFYNLYNYIYHSQRNLIIKLEIDKAVREELNRIEKQFKNEYDKTKELSGLGIFGSIGQKVQKKKDDDKNNYKLICDLKREECIEEIKKEIFYALKKDNFSNENGNNLYREKSERSLKKQYAKSLNGIKFKGQNLIENNDMNEYAFENLYDFLTIKQIESLQELIMLEKQKAKSYYDLQILRMLTTNQEKIFAYLTASVVDDKIKSFKEKTMNLLNENQKLKRYLTREKVYNIDSNEIDINNLKLEGILDKINGKLLNYLRAICNLQHLKQKDINLDENIEDNVNKLSITEQNKIKSQIKELLDEEEIYKKEVQSYELSIKDIRDSFSLNLTKKYEETTKRINAIEQLERETKTPEIKKLERDENNNIYLLYAPTLDDTLTRLEAIHIYYVYRKLKEYESDGNQETHNLLIKYLQNENNKFLTNSEKTCIRNISNKIINDLYNKKKDTEISEGGKSYGKKHTNK